MQFPDNTSIDFDKHCKFMVEQGERAKKSITSITGTSFVLAVVCVMLDWLIPACVMAIVFLISVLFRIFIPHYSKYYFKSRQEQTFRYEFNAIRRLLNEKVSEIERNVPQIISINDMVALRKNPGKIILQVLNMSLDTNTKDYFIRIAEIESKLNHSFAKHINEIPRSIRNYSIVQLLKSLKIDIDDNKLSYVFPVYSFECKNENGIVVDKLDIVLNVDVLRKIVDGIDDEINISRN